MSTDPKRLQKEQGRRLRAAREHMGLGTQKEGAAFLKASSDTYPQHENGTRSMKHVVSDYAAKYGVAEEWLLWGRNPPDWAIGEPGAQAERAPGVAHHLAAWRDYRRMTGDDLAGALGVSLQMVEGWERGDIDLSDKWLRRIAQLFETTPGLILDVDPAAVASGLLELWQGEVQRQREMSDKLQAIRRTGTAG